MERIYLSSINNSKIMKVSREEAKEKANQKIKAATKEADDIIKDLRQLREQKGADVKEHELIDKKKRLDDHY